ncbi:MAG: hypothetical protein LUG16_01880, partial [Candidatus Gastranaerophilales bacterium]|nr:hypothetical protein [Candidatus Gastranaerophilales bacterium]
LKASGVDTANMSAIEATLECFKSIPSSIGKSFNSFRTGAALTNIKNAFGINKKENSKGTKTDNKSYEEPENIKTETKAETKADTKQPETKPETKTEAKIETKQEIKAETKTEVKAEQKPEVKAEQKPEVKSEQKPEVKADTKQPETKPETKTETKPEVKAETKPEVVQQDIGAEGQSGYSKKLASLSEEEAAAFERTKNILDSQGIEFSDEELLMNEDIWDLDESLTNNGAANCHGSAYGFNYELRNKPEGYIPENLESRILDKGLENLSPLKKNETVYRGVNGNRFFKKNLEYVKSLINAKKGDVISDKGYGYASFSKKIANHYSDGGLCDGLGARMKIIVPEGSKVSIGGKQHEMLFPRNAQFEVVEQAKIAEDGIMEIVLKYILPKN